MAMVRKTLDAMSAEELQDREEGGFFRHCAEADWTGPQLEKLLEDNLGIAQLFLDAGCLLNDDSYKETAGRTVDWLMEHLFDAAGPGFAAVKVLIRSISACRWNPAERRSSRRWTPAVTRLPTPRPSVCCWKRPGSWGAASWQTPHCRSWRHLIRWPSKDVQHAYTGGAPGPEPAFLIDWASLLSANMSAHAFTAEERFLERATSVASELIDRFFDQDKGGFFDIERDAEASAICKSGRSHCQTMQLQPWL